MTQLSALPQQMTAAWSQPCPGMDAGWDKYSSNTVKDEKELAHWDHSFPDAIWDPQYLLILGKTQFSASP